MILIKYHNDPFSIFLKKLWGNISAKFRRNWLKVVAPGKSNIWGLEHTWTAVVPDLQITYSKSLLKMHYMVLKINNFRSIKITIQYSYNSTSRNTFGHEIECMLTSNI